jgi:hypothetical protein
MKKKIVTLLGMSIVLLTSSYGAQGQAMLGSSAPQGAGTQGIHNGSEQTTSAWDNLGKDFKDLGSGIGQVLHGVVTLPEQGVYYIGDKIQDGVHSVESAVSNTYDRAKDSVSNKYHRTKNAISNAGHTIKHGIENAENEVVQGARDVAGATIMAPDLAIHGLRKGVDYVDDGLQNAANKVSGHHMSNIYNTKVEITNDSDSSNQSQQNN